MEWLLKVDAFRQLTGAGWGRSIRVMWRQRKEQQEKTVAEALTLHRLWLEGWGFYSYGPKSPPGFMADLGKSMIQLGPFDDPSDCIAAAALRNEELS